MTAQQECHLPKILKTLFDKEIEKLDLELENLNSKRATVEKTIATAKDNHANEKQSFDNWVQTRKTLGSPDKDREVVECAKKLDEFRSSAFLLAVRNKNYKKRPLLTNGKNL